MIPVLKRILPGAVPKEVIDNFNQLSEYFRGLASTSSQAAGGSDAALTAHVANVHGNPHGTVHSQLLAVKQADDSSNDPGKGKHVTNALVKKYEDHRLASSGVHGVTGNVVGTTDSQTLSGKHFGGASHYSEFEADGTLKFVGDATNWNDINLSLVPPAGQAAALPAIVAINSDAYLSAYAFSGTNPTPDQLHGSLEVLHDYKEGSDISFHVHWAATTADSGDVKWQLRYAWFNRDGVPSGTTVAVVVATSGVAWKEQRTTFTISGTGMTIGSRFIACLFRDAVDVDDTYAELAATYDMGLHYERDTVGSRQVTSK